jgi:hypothetical protein
LSGKLGEGSRFAASRCFVEDRLFLRRPLDSRFPIDGQLRDRHVAAGRHGDIVSEDVPLVQPNAVAAAMAEIEDLPVAQNVRSDALAFHERPVGRLQVGDHELQAGALEPRVNLGD